MSDIPESPLGPQPSEPTTPEPDDDGVFGKSVIGVVWAAIEKSGGAIIVVIVHIVLARLLAPEHFGLVAMAVVVIGFVSLIKDQGFDDAIVQREDLDPLHLDTAMWTVTGLSLVLAGIGVAAAPLVAWAFGEPELTEIFRVLILTLPVLSTSTMPIALLRRRLDFKPLSIRSLISATAGGVVAVAMALDGWGVWSLVGQVVVQRLVSSIILWRACGWLPRLRFSRSHFHDLFSFGTLITADRVINFFNRQFDDVLVGVALGPAALGYYTIAYEILKGMTDIIIRTLSSVAMPTFSRLQSKAAELRQAYLGAIQISSLAAFPLFAIFAVVAPELFVLVYGPEWRPAIEPAQVLALVGIIHSVALLNGPMFQASGRLKTALGITAVNGVLNVIGFLIAVYVFETITAVAASYVIVCYIMVPVEIVIVGKLIGFDARSYLRQLVFPVLGAAAVAGATYGLKLVLGDALWMPARAGVLIAAGLAVYAVLALLFLPERTRRMVVRIKDELLAKRRASKQP